jgi:hypothetical protein
MEDVEMSINSSEQFTLKRLRKVGEVSARTEEELLEGGKVSQTKGSPLGSAADPSADDFRLSG